MSKVRLDVLLVDRGLAESRAKAQGLVMAGQVRVNGQPVLKPSHLLPADSLVQIDLGPEFVSRGGEKLAAALHGFGISVAGLVCADVGASTGGFTDCLLQNGARRVYAIDVGKGILHWKLRNDPRVVALEDTNARFLEHLPEPVDLATIDASFISLKILLPVVKAWLKAGQAEPGQPGHPPPDGVIALIKPQFEAGRQEVAKGAGVIRDPAIHRRILLDVLAFAAAQGFFLRDLAASPILGPKGNMEFLAWLGLSAPPTGTVDVENLALACCEPPQSG